MKFGVVIFPGSNCDQDSFFCIKNVIGEKVDYIWHQETDVSGYDCIILPGGFSYGDYLRTGAVARFSPVMQSVIDYANNGGHLIGICNGFQILCEAHLLPGVLTANDKLKFICKYVNLKIENDTSDWTNLYKKGDIINIPVAHHSGNYFAEPDVIKSLEDNNQILFRYCDEKGNVTPEANINGSCNNIAGIINKAGNVAGMMPHPERAVEDLLCSTDGINVFKSLVERMK
ncbi:MAG: phosphoribosylformylglycinamidine synthase subunit PurQ [Armatimonadetes bacterium]|nr:phosphoribosylformylglycinamidine synthase subunit PurQ [Candidatus Hippobium faecium]